MLGTSQGPAYIILVYIRFFIDIQRKLGVDLKYCVLFVKILEIWIVESNAMKESEHISYKTLSNYVDIRLYSKAVTKKFHAKGLAPCLRGVHSSIEISKKLDYYEKTEDLNRYKV